MLVALCCGWLGVLCALYSTARKRLKRAGRPARPRVQLAQCCSQPVSPPWLTALTSLPCTLVLQRQAKSVGGRGARTYQDERFSYVVLGR